jgi:hypothetical protein
MPAIIVAQACNPFGVDVSAKLVDRSMIDGTDTAKVRSQWRVVAGVLTSNGMRHVPAVHSLHGKVICPFHHNPESGHSGAIKTTELVSKDFN